MSNMMDGIDVRAVWNTGRRRREARKKNKNRYPLNEHSNGIRVKKCPLFALLHGNLHTV